MTSDTEAMVPLGTLFDIGAGKSVTPASRHGEPRYPFLRTSNVFWGRVDLTDVDAMHFTPEELENKALKRGDLLVCEGGDIGRSAIWDGALERCSFQNHLHRLRPKHGEVVPLFYMYYLQAGFTQLGIYEGAGNKTTIPNLSKNRLAGLVVPAPNKHEHQRSAALLMKVQRAAQGQSEIARTVQELKAATMRQLFTRGLRAEVLKDTELGPIPGSWNVRSSSEIFRLTSGTARPKDISKTTNELCRIPVYGGNGVMGYSAKWMLDSSKTLVIGRVGEYCGAVHLASGKLWITDNALFIKEWLRNDIDVEYLAHYLRYYDLNRFKRMAGQPLVTQSVIGELRLAIPMLTEQHEIAQILDAIDAKIFHHNRKQIIAQDLFNTLLCELMTDQINVSELEIDTSEVVAC